MNSETDTHNIDNFELNNITNFFKHPLGLFFGKVLILATTISFVFPDFSQLDRGLKSDQGKIITLDFIKNPRVLLELSKLHENKGKFDSAIREMTIAIGILEIHNVSKETFDLYNNRLESLIKKRDENFDNQ